MTRSESFAAFDVTADEWQTIRRAIDNIFDELQARIQRARPELTCRGERVQAARFHFNYRAFDPGDGEGREPLVVGIRFEPRDNRIWITGDISTEESGRILYDEGCERQATASSDEIETAAAEIAHCLAGQWEVILHYFGSLHR